MKKNRLIAMLLTAALTLSSLPLAMATTVSAAETVDALAELTPVDCNGEAATLVEAVYEGNRYLHFYNRPNTEANLHYCLPQSVTAGKHYRLYFDARVSQPYEFTNGFWVRSRTNLGLRGETGNKNSWMCPIKLEDTDTVDYGKVDINSNPESQPYKNSCVLLTDKWQRFAYDMPVNSGSANTTSPMFNISSWYAETYDFPYDIDNITLAVIDDSTGAETSLYTVTLDNVTTSDVVNTDSEGYTNGTFWDRTGLGSNDASATAADSIIVEDFNYYSIPAGSSSNTINLFSYEDVKLQAGYKYVLSGSMRVGQIKPNDNTEYTAYFAYELGEFDGTYDGYINEQPFEISTEWTEIPAATLEVEEDTTLSELLCQVSHNVPVDVALTLVAKVPNEDNLLDVVEPTATGDITETEIEENSYLHFYDRPDKNTNLHYRLPVASVTQGTHYRLYFDARIAEICADEQLSLRVRTNLGLNDEVTNSYATPLAMEDTDTVDYGEVDGTYIKPTDSWQRFAFDMVVSGNSENYNNPIFNIGGGNTPLPFDVDNIVVVVVDNNGDETPLFDTVTFDDVTTEDMVNADGAGYTNGTFWDRAMLGVNNTPTDATAIVATESTYSTIAASETENTALTYAINDTITPGTYNVNGWVRVPLYDASDVTADDATMNIVLANADTEEDVLLSKNVGVTNEWTYFDYSFRVVEDTDISTLTLSLDGKLPLDFKNITFFMENGPARPGRPDPGIVMMLLRKKGAAVSITKKVEFIDLDLETEPKIFNSNPATVQTIESAGWYGKNSNTVATTISYVTEDGNSFLRVTDLDTAQRGIFWNTGVVLQPGTYTLTMDMRVSETEESEAYNSKAWRDDKKQTMQVRANLGDPNGKFAPHYKAFDPVDLDSPMNSSGQVYGNCQIINREWTTYTDTIVIDREMLAVFKVGGGTGGEVDAHGFDIDNISLIGYVTTTKSADGEAVVETPELPGNLIDNGDLTEEPKIVSTWSASATKAWNEYDGEDPKRDDKGNALEEKMYYDQTITWADGALTVSGRQFNQRPVIYNTGLTLEPGTYKLSVDLKTAKEGETTAIRALCVNTADLKYLGTVSPVNIKSDAWTTASYEFTVTSPIDVSVRFWGGMSTSHIHDFMIDNLSIVKLG